MKLRNLLALLILLLGSAFRCHSQGMGPDGSGMGSMGTMTYSISGSVRDDATGQALNGIGVDLKRGGVTLESTLTRINGGFEFDSAPNGEYVVEMQAEGY